MAVEWESCVLKEGVGRPLLPSPQIQTKKGLLAWWPFLYGDIAVQVFPSWGFVVGWTKQSKAHKQAKLLSVQLSIIDSQTISGLTFQDAQVFASLIIWYLFECFLLLTVSLLFWGETKRQDWGISSPAVLIKPQRLCIPRGSDAAYSQRAHQGVNYAWELPGCTAVRGVSSSPHVSSEKQL